MFEPAYCISCREGVHRINSAWYNCPCEEGYVESSSGNKPYCCDKRCGDCNATGCISCTPHTNRKLVDGMCVCIGNMVERPNSTVCTCPSLYFELQGSCERCPYYCHECYFSQESYDLRCLSCPPNSRRKSALNADGFTYCLCQTGFMETTPDSPYCVPRHCLKEQYYCEKCVANR